MREAVNIPTMANVATTADNATAVQFCVNTSGLNAWTIIVGKKTYHRSVGRVPVDWFK